MGSAVESWLHPADAVRRDVLQWLGGWARPFIRDRDARVTLIGAFVVVTALVATLIAPLWLLVLGPVLVGVPHLLADARYLVVRPGLHHRRDLWLCVGVPLAVAAVLPGARWGLLAVAGAIVAARSSLRRQLAALAVWGIAYACALRAGRMTDLVIAHLHNLIAIALWWWWRPRSGRGPWWIVGLFVAGSALLFSGLAEPCLVWAHGIVAPRSGIDLGRMAAELTSLRDPEWALRLVLWYAFAQAVHYGMWLRLIPEDDRLRATPRSFAATWRALRDDFGLAPLLATAALAIGLAVWGAFNLAAARDGYLRASLFHGYLEFSAIALFWIEGWRPLAAGASGGLLSSAESSRGDGCPARL